MVDKEDGTIIETSLREMEEELGIPPGDYHLKQYPSCPLLYSALRVALLLTAYKHTNVTYFIVHLAM